MKKNKFIETFMDIVKKEAGLSSKENFNRAKEHERLRQAKIAFDLFITLIIVGTCCIFWAILLQMPMAQTLIGFFLDLIGSGGIMWLLWDKTNERLK